MKRFAEALNFRMYQLGYTMTEVARRTKVRLQCIQSFVHGRDIPSKKMVERISMALGMDFVELAALAGADHAERKYGVLMPEGGHEVEFEALRALWIKLSAAERKIILGTMRHFVEQNEHEQVKARTRTRSRLRPDRGSEHVRCPAKPSKHTTS